MVFIYSADSNFLVEGINDYTSNFDKDVYLVHILSLFLFLILSINNNLRIQILSYLNL